MTGLDNRLRLLEDERSIQRTMARYAHSLDHGDLDALMDCWAEGAVLEWPVTGRLEGRDALRAGFHRHTHAPEHVHKHLMVEPLIEVDGDTASATSMFVRLDFFDGRPIVHSFGRYFDKLARCPDGAWRLTHRLPAAEAFCPDLGIVLRRGLNPVPGATVAAG